MTYMSDREFSTISSMDIIKTIIRLNGINDTWIVGHMVWNTSVRMANIRYSISNLKASKRMSRSPTEFALWL